jgi:hypothetical protein
VVSANVVSANVVSANVVSATVVSGIVVSSIAVSSIAVSSIVASGIAVSARLRRPSHRPDAATGQYSNPSGGPRQVPAPDRQPADALTGGRKNGVGKRGGDDGGSRLAYPAPFRALVSAQMHLDLGRVLESHDRIGIEIGLLDTTIPDGDP